MTTTPAYRIRRRRKRRPNDGLGPATGPLRWHLYHRTRATGIISIFTTWAWEVESTHTTHAAAINAMNRHQARTRLSTPAANPLNTVHLMDAAHTLHNTIRNAYTTTQDDYTLAGPSDGGTP